MALPNVRDVIGGGTAEALYNLCQVLGISLSYTHEPGKIGASAVTVWAKEINTELSSTIFPQLGLVDGDAVAIKIPNQSTIGDGVFIPATGDEVVWGGDKYHVLWDGVRLSSGSGYMVVIHREVQKMIGV